MPLACLFGLLPLAALGESEDVWAEITREARRLERTHQRALTALEQDEQAARQRLEAGHRERVTQLKEKQEAAISASFQRAGAGDMGSAAALMGGAGFQFEERLLAVHHDYRDQRTLDREVGVKRRALEREHEFAVQALHLCAIADAGERSLAQRRQQIGRQHTLRRDELEQEHRATADQMAYEAEQRVAQAEADAAKYLLDKTQAQVKAAEASGAEINPFSLMSDPGYLERIQQTRRIRDELAIRLGELELELAKRRAAIDHDEEDALDDLL